MRSEGKFYDDKNFPRGFNRSGVFTIGESSLLENYGRTMSRLCSGELEPESEVERQFVAEMNGQLELRSDFAKCWMKYVTRTSQKRKTYTLCDSVRRQSQSFDDDMGGDSDLEY
ncbi:hypothetical protein A3K86_21575 [Photobacterium jeanii]|uniref:Macrodomain Ori protein n=1 Tax=Photobacterium jeanii TaxID=858640 RepID=A0A178K2M6_9GAMM|nr:DUF413 domain-containing protein [Photobacterium jeanii]OAN11521.1 hypothetical protein A3K86_21575 [Photobacterium jeanii]PST91039.1 hypothetical protein C9I91_10680 [Photobacterium jeanii]